MKPKIFIGSSVEGIHIAKAVQVGLEYNAEVTIWNQGVFKLSSNTLIDLFEVIENSDFAIMIFSPDDEVTMRKQTNAVVRDNVLFELGLFMGSLGRDKVFYLLPRGIDMHIPTDLIGITPGTFDPNRSDGNLNASVGSFCTQVMTQINKIGPEKIYREIYKLMEKVNPLINANIKNGIDKIKINLSNKNQNILHSIEENPNYERFMRFWSNGSTLGNNTCSNGGINDLYDGRLDGFIFEFTADYKEKLMKNYR